MGNIPIFGEFKECVTDRPTDGRTDGPTVGPTDRRSDKPSYRDARTHLKKDRTASARFEFCLIFVALSFIDLKEFGTP